MSVQPDVRRQKLQPEETVRAVIIISVVSPLLVLPIRPIKEATVVILLRVAKATVQVRAVAAAELVSPDLNLVVVAAKKEETNIGFQ